MSAGKNDDREDHKKVLLYTVERTGAGAKRPDET